MIMSDAVNKSMDYLLGLGSYEHVKLLGAKLVDEVGGGFGIGSDAEG